ncbi:hypothetical protein FOCC_FOCC003154, partial [Frankliniella occidentalis]
AGCRCSAGRDGAPRGRSTTRTPNVRQRRQPRSAENEYDDDDNDDGASLKTHRRRTRRSDSGRSLPCAAAQPSRRCYSALLLRSGSVRPRACAFGSGKELTASERRVVTTPTPTSLATSTGIINAAGIARPPAEHRPRDGRDLQGQKTTPGGK